MHKGWRCRENAMTAHHFVVSGPEDIIQQIEATSFGEGVKLGASRSADGLTDAVDAPLGPDEIRQILELITVTLTTSTAAVAFFERVRGLFPKKAIDAPKELSPSITLKDARTGQRVIDFDEASDITKAVEQLMNRD